RVPPPCFVVRAARAPGARAPGAVVCRPLAPQGGLRRDAGLAAAVGLRGPGRCAPYHQATSRLSETPRPAFEKASALTQSKRGRAVLQQDERSSGPRFALEGKDAFPVVLHADDRPAVLLRLFVEGKGERADPGVRQPLRRAVGVLALVVLANCFASSIRTLLSLGVDSPRSRRCSVR